MTQEEIHSSPWCEHFGYSSYTAVADAFLTKDYVALSIEDISEYLGLNEEKVQEEIENLLDRGYIREVEEKEIESDIEDGEELYCLKKENEDVEALKEYYRKLLFSE